MDGFTFTSEIIKAVAWPTAVIALVFLLRKPIIELAPLMKKLKYKELELEFSQEMQTFKIQGERCSSRKGNAGYFSGGSSFKSTRSSFLFYSSRHY